MNTGTRRFILRLAVGLLAFLLGVAAAWALGGFTPFQSTSRTRHYKHRNCGRSSITPPSYRRLESGSVDDPIFLKGPHGLRLNRILREDQQPPPPPAKLR